MDRAGAIFEAAREAIKGWSTPEWMPGFEEKNEAYYQFLFHLARLMPSHLTVELGTWKGTSALCMAMGNPSGKVVTIDTSQGQIDPRCRASNIEFRHASSLDPQPDLTGIDLLFIDTEHDGKLPDLELAAWEKRLNPDGVVVFDDIWLNEDMLHFWYSLSGKKCELPLHGAAGFGVLLR